MAKSTKPKPAPQPARTDDSKPATAPQPEPRSNDSVPRTIE